MLELLKHFNKEEIYEHLALDCLDKNTSYFAAAD
jgi:hypothetical protein